MSDKGFPVLKPGAITDTRAALHAYSGILGALLKTCRKRRKHWWHASLRPSVRGLSTGVIHGEIDFELELDLAHSRLRVKTADALSISEALTGQSAGELAGVIKAALAAVGAGDPLVAQQFDESQAFADYSAEHSVAMQRAMSTVAAVLEEFRAGIREETSPIQLWPHHFDLSMIWLPGEKVHGIDEADEEAADKQVNFGFTFGDAGITEPYFYITAYPMPDALPETRLPGPARWHSEGFSGVVLTYAELGKMPQPRSHLLQLWQHVLSAAKAQL